MAPQLITTLAFVAPFLLLIVFLMSFQTIVSGAIAREGCQERCGDIEVPYPFGIGPNCSLDEGFELSCNTSTQTLFLLNAPVLSISISKGLVWVNKTIPSVCYDSKTGEKKKSNNQPWGLSGTPFKISSTNTFTVIGCDTIATIYYNNINGGCIIFNCYEYDYESSSSSGISHECSGFGCCQTTIPNATSYYFVDFITTYNSTPTNKFSWCSYAMLMDDHYYKDFGQGVYHYTDYKLHEQHMPLALDWAIRDENCTTNVTNSPSSFACRGNSRCVGTYIGTGYNCYCPDGYQGNPYLQGGCQDIDECAAEKNPCNKRKCHNLLGTYSCSCSLLMRPHGNGTTGYCQLYVPYLIGAIITLGFGSGFVILLAYFAIEKRIKLFEKRRQDKIKHKFFIQNKGLLLEQLIDSHDDTTEKMRIFRFDELEKATNRFDDALVLGRGGHGEVYKGILSDQRVVAIKRSTNINKEEIDQFINEVAILSNVNHRNVVKLFGCCLETEVPLLVYEFISNGTLYNHLHAVEHCSLTWKHRLRIALEAAGAISYLHSSASVPVFHRDIKSANILLDDYFTVKVSDFGISRSVQLDQTGINTNIVGTLGYIDPEYFDSGRLTQKSDVYSLGVILVEVLTREKPIGSSRIFEGGSLTANFNIAMRERRLFDIIDPEVVYEENRKEIEAVAKIAEMCLKRRGEERPTMKEMEMQLEALWRSNKQRSHPSTSQISSEQQQLIPLDLSTELDTRYYSFPIESQSSSL